MKGNIRRWSLTPEGECSTRTIHPVLDRLTVNTTTKTKPTCNGLWRQVANSFVFHSSRVEGASLVMHLDVPSSPGATSFHSNILLLKLWSAKLVHSLCRGGGVLFDLQKPKSETARTRHEWTSSNLKVPRSNLQIEDSTIERHRLLSRDLGL